MGMEITSFTHRPYFCLFPRHDISFRCPPEKGSKALAERSENRSHSEGDPLQIKNDRLAARVEGQEAARSLLNALQSSDLRYSDILDSLAEGVLLTDLEDLIWYINPRMTEICGYAPE